MTVATLVCLTASLCVNPAHITAIFECGPSRTCVSIAAELRPTDKVDLPIAEVLRRLDQGPVAVTWPPEPKP